MQNPQTIFDFLVWSLSGGLWRFCGAVILIALIGGLLVAACGALGSVIAGLNRKQ